MNCKNCDHPFNDRDNYCRNCGGKIIRNRLTIKNLFAHFSEQFLNYDNKFLQTFLNLFKQPEDVIGGYISGLRKKYVDAVSYFAIALTLSGFFYFIFLKWFPDALNFSDAFMEMDQTQQQLNSEINTTIFEYQGLIFFLFIPILAIMSRLVFLKNKKYNFSEHLVINLYAYSHLSISVTILYFLTIWFPQIFWVVALLVLPLQVLYFAYALKRLYQLDLAQIILKTMLFFVILIPIIILIMIVVIVVLYMNGFYDEIIEAEKAKQGISYIISSAMNWTS